VFPTPRACQHHCVPVHPIHPERKGALRVEHGGAAARLLVHQPPPLFCSVFFSFLTTQKVELAVKKCVEGRKVLNRDALKNPGACSVGGVALELASERSGNVALAHACLVWQNPWTSSLASPAPCEQSCLLHLLFLRFVAPKQLFPTTRVFGDATSRCPTIVQSEYSSVVSILNIF